MAEKITFELNSGDTQVWEQDRHDGSVALYSVTDNGSRENEITVPPGDMVMLANLYRSIKTGDIRNSFVNYYGINKLKTGDDLLAALEKQIPKKPIRSDVQDIRYVTSFNCPACGGGFTGIGVSAYCYHCGQALDWYDYINTEYAV